MWKALRPLPKTDLEKTKTATTPLMKNPVAYYVHDVNLAKKKWPIFPTILPRLRSGPRHSEAIFAKKRYTSIVARALGQGLRHSALFV